MQSTEKFTNVLIDGVSLVMVYIASTSYGWSHGSTTDLEVVDGDPWVGGKPLHEGNKELNTAVPVSQQQNSQNEIGDPRDGRVGIEQLCKAHKTRTFK